MTRWVVAALAIEAAVLAALLTIALDVLAHKRVERLGGVNIWGYRGPVMRRKQPNETRIAVTGGDGAFGWGVAASETLAPSVRQLVALEIDRPGRPLRLISAVNLGATGLAPGQYAGWITHFAYLQPDIVCIVVDPRERHGSSASLLPDRESTAFAWFGYAPILPLVVEEKGALHGSSLLQAVGSAAAGADHLVGRVVGRASSDDDRGVEPTAAYARAVETAARTALTIGAGVVVVAPPYRSAAEVGDHDALAVMIASRFFGERRVRFVDLGDAPDMYDEAVWLKERAFSTAGHAKAAEYVTPAVLDLLSGR